VALGVTAHVRAPAAAAAVLPPAVSEKVSVHLISILSRYIDIADISKLDRFASAFFDTV
jgi:hypothetical protein